MTSSVNIPDPSSPSIGFIGLGSLGKGFSVAMAQSGHRVTGVYSRTAASAQWAAQRIEGCRLFEQAQALCDQVDLVFITTPDGVIGQVVSEIAWRPGQGVVHCSGAMSEDILEPAASQGAATGAFHPCQTFAGTNSPQEAQERLTGVSFAVAGNGWVLEFLQGLAGALGGDPIAISSAQRPLYHAASVMACGHLIALLRSAIRVWEGMGFTEEQAIRALYPICRATLENFAKHGPVASATGPAIRGDTSTIKAHLEALGAGFSDLIPAYTALARESLPIAEARGLDQAHLDEMDQLLQNFRPGNQ